MTRTSQPIPPAPKLTAAQVGARCLVTGGAGYVGRTLVARLRAAGCAVRSLDVAPHRHGDGVETVVGDLRDYAAVRAAADGVATVFHTAALINLLTVYRPSVARTVFEVNAGGTRNVARAAAEAGARALVHTSSFNVTFDGRVAVHDESMPYAVRAKDLYTRSKIEAERIALAADRPGGLRVCALRPGGIWGSDTGSLMIRSFLSQLVAGKFKALIGDPDTVTDNTHVENLVDAQLLAARALLEKPDVAGGQAYAITDGEPVNGMEWFRPIAEGLGYRFPRVWLPTWLTRSVALAMETAHMLGAHEPLLTLRGIANLSENSHLSIAKAQRDLGYVPRYRRANGVETLLPAARTFAAAQAGCKS
ncbi:MAG: NAD-dependent epimerase/dehydratase family protein [Gammaproteobacteria bacterium]|nr:NAD-dependent epimerase/dehydratase family protein [Gammaproteobacteria bacterium]